MEEEGRWFAVETQKGAAEIRRWRRRQRIKPHNFSSNSIQLTSIIFIHHNSWLSALKIQITLFITAKWEIGLDWGHCIFSCFVLQHLSFIFRGLLYEIKQSTKKQTLFKEIYHVNSSLVSCRRSSKNLTFNHLIWLFCIPPQHLAANGSYYIWNKYLFYFDLNVDFLFLFLKASFNHKLPHLHFHCFLPLCFQIPGFLKLWECYLKRYNAVLCKRRDFFNIGNKTIFKKYLVTVICQIKFMPTLALYWLMLQFHKVTRRGHIPKISDC